MAIRVAMTGLRRPDRPDLEAQARRRFEGRAEIHTSWWGEGAAPAAPAGTFDVLVLDLTGVSDARGLAGLVRAFPGRLRVVSAAERPGPELAEVLGAADAWVCGFGLASAIMAVGGALGLLERRGASS